MIVDEIELMSRLKDVEPLPPDVSERARMVLRAAMALDADPEVPNLGERRAHRGGRRWAARGWRPRRVVVAITGMVVLAASGGVAAAAVLASNPTPRQAANIYQHWYPDKGAGRTPGTRPALNSEAVLCDYQGVTSFPAAVRHGSLSEGFASSAALTTPLSAQMLVNACAQDPITGNTVPTSTPATLCVTTAQGAVSFSKPVDWPVVIFGNATCAGSGDRPAPADLLAQVNQRRNLEVAIDTVPQACPTRAQALSWVHHQLTKLNANLAVQTRNGGPSGMCWLPTVLWAGGDPGTTIGTPVVQVGPTRYPASSPPGGRTPGVPISAAPNPPPAG